jgi:PAT family beta-lactamase induction signal transducer AmpG
MQLKQYTRPFYIFFLMLPSGISQGFVTVGLPFILTQRGFPVATTAGIVAVGLSANLWRFLWGPIVDLSLSLKKWYWLSLVGCTGVLLLLCVTPFTVKGTALLTAIVFLSQIAGTFNILPVNAFISQSVEESKKGLASGWFQAGALVGVGVGGGAGVWLAAHYSVLIAGITLSSISIVFALVMTLLKDIQHQAEKNIVQEVVSMGKGIVELVKVPVALFVMFLVVMPIGTGASANLWSAIAQDWKTDANTVALVTGILSGLVSAVGCVAGGIIADRRGVWFAYLGSGILCALITFIMGVMPMQPWVYIGGVLSYTFGIGMINAAFTATIMFVIGKKHAATRYSLIASLGNIPVVYMTALNGWSHDQFNSKYMLMMEAAIGVAFVLIFFLILQRLKQKQLIPIVAE